MTFFQEWLMYILEKPEGHSGKSHQTWETITFQCTQQKIQTDKQKTNKYFDYITVKSIARLNHTAVVFLHIYCNFLQKTEVCNQRLLKQADRKTNGQKVTEIPLISTPITEQLKSRLCSLTLSFTFFFIFWFTEQDVSNCFSFRKQKQRCSGVMSFKSHARYLGKKGGILHSFTYLVVRQ